MCKDAAGQTEKCEDCTSKDCKHENLKYCECCGGVHCVDCGEKWVETQPANNSTKGGLKIMSNENKKKRPPPPPPPPPKRLIREDVQIGDKQKRDEKERSDQFFYPGTCSVCNCTPCCCSLTITYTTGGIFSANSACNINNCGCGKWNPT